MRIGELAQNAGVNIQTIRFYERRRILREAPRTDAGYRIYGERDLEDLCFIRQAQQLGFTLREITQLVKLHRAVSSLPRGGARPRESREIARVARARLTQVEEKLQRLRVMRAQLVAMIERLKRVDDVRCPVPRKGLSPPSTRRTQRTS
jgi:DNA-binding transcriptional MerR regulator